MGRYAPRRVVPSAEVETRCHIPPGTALLNSGVGQRHWADVPGGETATYMGEQAAREALAEAGLEGRDLDLIINASGTPQQAIPDGACLLQRALGLGQSGIRCMSVHSTCLSFVSALEVAAAFIAIGRHRRILVVSTDVASAGLNFEEAESATLFGDLAAAAVIVPTPAGEASALHRMIFETHAEGADLTTIRGCGTERPPGADWTRPEDNLFAMDGPGVLKFAIKRLPTFIQRLVPPDDPPLELVVPHQSSKTGMSVTARLFERHAGVTGDKVVDILADYGNCVAASIPGALYTAIREGRLQRGDRFCLVGTGAGLSLAGMIATY